MEDFNVIVMGMEAFGARKEAPLQTCLAEVEQSDIYVGVIGFRLGSVHPDTGKSFTQMEYERAVELDKEILIYLMDEVNARVAPSMVDRGLDAEKLDTFKAVLKERHTVEFFVSEEDLVAKLKRDFGRLLTMREPKVKEPDEFITTAALLEQFALYPSQLPENRYGYNSREKESHIPHPKNFVQHST